MLVNTLKSTVELVKKRLQEQGWKLEQVPWCKQAFWVEHNKGRLDIGNTLEHFLGYIYIQEAASMIPPVVLNPKLSQELMNKQNPPTRGHSLFHKL